MANQKYVVLENNVGSWNMGDVFTEKDLDAENVKRLIELGVVAETTGSDKDIEAKLDKKRLADAPARETADTEEMERTIATLRADLAPLKAQVAELERDNARLKASDDEKSAEIERLQALVSQE